jgi:PAS domain S-box-containing protein
MEPNRWYDHVKKLNGLFEAIDHAADIRSLQDTFEHHFFGLVPEAKGYCFWLFHNTTTPYSAESQSYSAYMTRPFDIAQVKTLLAKFVKGTEFIYRSSLESEQVSTSAWPDASAGIASDITLPVFHDRKVRGILHLLGERPACFPEPLRYFIALAAGGFARRHAVLSETSSTSGNPGIDDQDNIIQKIIDTVPNYIYVKDKNSNFVLVNQAVANLFETSKEDIVQQGLPFIEKHKVSIVLDRDTDRSVIEKGEIVESEEQMTLASGETRWVRTTKIPLALKSGKILVLGVSVDITPIKMQAKALEDAKHLKEQFLANISHELRTPINGIVGMIKMLEGTPTLPEQKKYLDAIRKSSETLQVLINDILDFSAIESGNIRFSKIGFKPKPLLTALVESFRYEARKKGLQLTLNYDPYVDNVLIGDPIRLNQILINMLSNALKFTEKGYVRVYVLRQNDNQKSAHLKFIIEDSGIGINENDLGRIFDSFEQANDKIAKKFGGTGLGLSIVKQLVELQKGSIDVESSAGKGTRFSIDLIFEVGSEEDMEVQQDFSVYDAASGQASSLEKCHILVVEDNEVNLLYSTMLLEKWAYTVDSATNGLEALEKLKESDYDVILMDMLMPVMDGEEATRFIRQQLGPPKSRTCIIAITANALDSDIQRYKDLGVDDCLTKPYTPAELRTIILKNLRKKDLIPSRKETDMIAPVVNLRYLEHLSNNDTGFIKEMVKSFVRESPKDMETMRLAANQKNWQQVRDIVHKIKPSLTFMGMHSAHEILNDIRNAAIAEDSEKTSSLINTLGVAVRRAIEELGVHYRT